MTQSGRRRLRSVLLTLSAAGVLLGAHAQEQTSEGQATAGTSPDAIQYTPAELPTEPLPEFPSFADKRIRLPLSLEDAIRIAVRNNLEIRVEQYDRSIARRRVVIERAVFDPLFDMSFSYADNREPTVSPLDFDPTNPVLGVRVNPFDVTTLRTGLRGTTLLGTSYQISAAESRFDSPEASLFALNPRYASRAKVTVAQPLLKGGWYKTVSANLRISRNNRFLTDSEFRLTATNTVYNVVSTYWNLVFAHDNYRSKTNALQLAIDQLRIDRQRHEAGAIARIELINPESQLARRKTEFDTAEMLYESTRDNLLDQINYTGKASLKRLWELRDEKSPYQNILVLPSSSPEAELLEYDRNQALATAFELREEYKVLALELKNRGIVIEVARNQLLPSLELSATWTQLGLDDNLRGSVDSVGRGRFYDWQVGVTLEVPLMYRGPLAEYSNAKDEYTKLVVEQQSLENTIVIEVDQAIRNLKDSYRRVRNLGREVELQEALLQAERQKLAAGRSIPYTVSQIENDLVDVQSQAIRATTNFEKFRAAYRRAVGTLLDDYATALDDAEK